jgi:hypothetical protein
VSLALIYDLIKSQRFPICWPEISFLFSSLCITISELIIYAVLASASSGPKSKPSSVNPGLSHRRRRRRRCLSIKPVVGSILYPRPRSRGRLHGGFRIRFSVRFPIRFPANWKDIRFSVRHMKIKRLHTNTIVHRSQCPIPCCLRPARWPALLVLPNAVLHPSYPRPTCRTGNKNILYCIPRPTILTWLVSRLKWTDGEEKHSIAVSPSY